MVSEVQTRLSFNLIKPNFFLIRFIHAGSGDAAPTYMEQKDSIFVQGITDSCTEEMLAQYFSAVGPVKVNFEYYHF